MFAGKHNALWLILSAITVVVDQLTKWLTVSNFELYDERIITSFFSLTRRHNPGAAFSFLADAGGWQHVFFVAMAVLVCGYVFWWLWKNPTAMRLQAVALCLVIGGAIGNTIDRIWHGYVVDFLLLHYNTLQWPAFNVADMAITGGVILLLWDAFFGKHEQYGTAE